MAIEEKFNVIEQWGIGNGGWVRIEAPAGHRSPRQSIPSGHVLYVKFGAAADNPNRLRTLEAYLHRTTEGGALSFTAWQQVKLGAIERHANRPDNANAIRYKMVAPGPLLRVAASQFSTSYGLPRIPDPRRKPPHWAAQMMLSQQADSEFAPVPEHVSKRSWQVIVESGDEPNAELPMEIRGTSEFFEAVARVYREVVALRPDPAQVIASANGIRAMSTVYYWIRRARELGVLDAGTRGKAG